MSRQTRSWGVICFLLSCWVTAPSSAAKSKRAYHYVALDAGAYGSNVQQRYQVQDSNQGLISTISGYARIRTGLRVAKKLHFEPSLGAVIPWRSGIDGTVKTFTFQIDLNATWTVFSFFRVRLGPGVNLLWILSKSQQVTLNNGQSTSTFHIPGGSRFPLTFSVQTGIEIPFTSRLSLNFDLVALAVASDSRRQFNGIATLGLVL